MTRAWIWVCPVGEPGYWARNPEPGEIGGLDPLSGLIIAHTDDERRCIDAARDGEKPS